MKLHLRSASHAGRAGRVAFTLSAGGPAGRAALHRSTRCRRAARRRGWRTAMSISRATGCRTEPVRGSAAASV